MLINELINNGANVSITISASDLLEVINYTVSTTRKELEQVIIDKKSENYLTRQQAAEMLGVSLVSLYRWSKRGYLVPLEVGGKRIYLKSDIDRVCLSKNINNQNL